MSIHSRRAARPLTWLAEQDPALAVLALWCRHRDDDGLTIAAMSAGETILYGPAFETLQPHEQTGLAAHHVLHVAFRHSARLSAMARRLGEQFDADVFNICADALINETLTAAGYGLPRPAVALTDVLPLVGPAAPSPREALARFDVERLYTALTSHAGRDGASRRASSGANPNTHRASLAERAADAGYRRDLHPTDAAAGGDEDADDAAWRDRLARAMAQSAAAGRGIGSLGFRLADLPAARTPWEVRLRGLVTRAVTPDARYSYRRPARRWLALESHARRSGGPLPGYEPSVERSREIPRIAVAIDMSGSVDDARLGRFATEIAGIGRRTGAEVHVLGFDTDVRIRRRMLGQGWESEITGLDLARGGGTSFGPAIAAAAALDPSIVIVLTDLDGPFGDAPGRLPVLWAVLDDPPVPPPFGQVLTLSR
ncbi:MAG: VWA-like domain-containing protein [Pseudomonadota bacterium]